MKRTNERTNERTSTVRAMRTASPIAAALDQLEIERANLVARLAKVDALIASMRDVFHLPKAATAAGRSHGGSRRGSGRSATISADSIRAELLRTGPISPGTLAVALGVPVGRLRYHLAQLEAQGVLTATGTTASRRVALADRSAKEAP